MSLTDAEIGQFAKDAIRSQIKTDRDRDTAEEWALTCLGIAEQDLKDSGYRITKRVRSVLIRELEAFARRESSND